MKRFFISLLVALPFLMSACTEEGFVKVFECDDEHPYFSKYTHQCYTTADERDEADAIEQAKYNKD